MLHPTFPLPDRGKDGTPPPSLLAFSEDRELVKGRRQTLVRVHDGAELERFTALLGDACEIALSEPFRRNRPALADEAPNGTVYMADSAAICLYLADRYASGRLAPALDDPSRGRFLYWMTYTPGAIEPA